MQGGLSSADYKRDVAQAIGIQYRLKLETARYNSKAIDLATYQAESKSFAADYERLYSKWQAVGKGVDFERDCKQRLDAMPMPAQTPAVQGKVARGDMPSAEYKRDVEQAADLQFQEGQLAKRVLKKEIDNAAYTKSIKDLGARLTPLIGKWQAAGKGSQFQSDSLQRARVLAAAKQSQAGPWRMTTGQELILAGVLLILPGYLTSFKRKKEYRELRKYEFEHRTAGGVVQFKTFEDSEEHTRRLKQAAGRTNAVGCLMILCVIGLFMTGIGIILVLAH